MKPCPWCGVLPTLVDHSDVQLYWCVVCDNNDCPMSEVSVVGLKTKEEAIAEWDAYEIREDHSCPWCAREPYIFDDYHAHFGWNWGASCYNAPHTVTTGTLFNTEADARERWNKQGGTDGSVH